MRRTLDTRVAGAAAALPLTYRTPNEPQPAAAGLLPGHVPDEHRDLHRHQRAGRLRPGAGGLDGHAAGDELRHRWRHQCADRRARADAVGTTAVLSARAADGRSVGRRLRLGGERAELRVADGGHLAGRLLPGQRGAVPLRRHRTGRAVLQGEGDLAGAGRRHHRGLHRAQSGRCHGRADEHAIRRRLSVADRRGRRGLRCAFLHRLPAAPGASRWRAHRPAAGRDRAPADLHRRSHRGGAGLRRDEPADDRHTIGDAAVPTPLHKRHAGAGMACAGHVRAELLHGPPDQALRRPAGDGRGRAAQRGLRRSGAVRRRPDAVPDRPVHPGRGLELPLHRWQHAADSHLSARGKDPGTGGRWTPACSPRWR